MRFIHLLALSLLLINSSAVKGQEEELMIYDAEFEIEVAEYDSDGFSPQKPELKIENIDSTYAFYFDGSLRQYERKYGVLKNGKMLLPQIFKRKQYKDSLYKMNLILSINKQYGLFNLEKEAWSIPMQYKFLERLPNGLYNAKKVDNSYVVVNNNGDLVKELIGYSIKKMESKSDFYLLSNSSKNSKQGLYDGKAKKITIPCTYSSITAIKNSNYFKIRKEEKCNLSDAYNNLKFSQWYDDIKVSSDSTLFIVKLNNYYGIIDKDEKIIVPLEYTELKKEAIYNGSYLVKNKENNYGCINLNGEITLPFIYSDAKMYKNSILVSKENKNGIVAFKDGKLVEIIPCKYDNISSSNNMYIVESESKFGLIDSQGNPVSGIKFDEIKLSIKLFSNKGLNIVRKGEKYFFAQNDGKAKGKKTYKNVEPFYNYTGSYYYGKLYYKVVDKKDHVGLADIYGKEIVRPEFDDVISGYENLVVVKKEGKVGLYHVLKKKMLLPIEYDTIILKSSGLYAINENNFYKIKYDGMAKVEKL
jgi:hypothetical protein